ncbi:MAG: winged helix-turn-helix domain-containing protein [Acidimicrobiia bacterium]
MRHLTRSQARRIAINAQGLASPRPARPNLGHLTRAIRSVGVLQIDSVNVVERAHHLTLFSRLGPYSTGLLERALEQRRIFEYWARMASFVPIEDFPLYRYRMQRRAAGEGQWIKDLNRRRPGYVESVYAQVVERGPLTASDLEEPGEKRGPWWGWADGKIALEYLFAAGRVSVAFRRNFTRYHDLVERVIPANHLDGPEIHPVDAQRQLLVQAAATLGVATSKDLIAYNWLGTAESRPIVKDLVAAGDLVEVDVEGWGKPAYLHRDAMVPREVRARALVNPFDTYMFNRERIESLHDFSYRIEIYVPKPKRVHGYYVFPFLLGEDLVARVDLKANRKAGVLTVPGAFLEDGADPVHVARELAVELGEMASWLGLGAIEIGQKGDLSPRLSKAV